MKIKVKYHNPKCKIKQFGNWIDLRSSGYYEFKAPQQILNGNTEKYEIDLYKLGFVEKGEKQVIIKPKNVVYRGL